jgi:hypothetical protein
MRARFIVLGALALVPLAVPAHSDTQYGTYTGAGSVVLSNPLGANPVTLLDNGAVVCHTASRQGTGGLCIPFSDLGTDDSVLVSDDQVGSAAIFQVCVDNDGDGVCGGGKRGDPGSNDLCSDRIVFSHSRDGANANPMRLPVDGKFLYDNFCGANGGFAGYIVIICAGTHADESGVHEHIASAGTVTTTTGGVVPSGDFCGGPVAAKAYIVQPD